MLLLKKGGFYMFGIIANMEIKDNNNQQINLQTNQPQIIPDVSENEKNILFTDFSTDSTGSADSVPVKVFTTVAIVNYLKTIKLL